jgi:hypothetical protein
VIPETSGHGGGGVIPISSSTLEFSMFLFLLFSLVRYSSRLGPLFGSLSVNVRFCCEALDLKDSTVMVQSLFEGMRCEFYLWYL